MASPPETAPPSPPTTSPSPPAPESDNSPPPPSKDSSSSPPPESPDSPPPPSPPAQSPPTPQSEPPPSPPPPASSPPPPSPEKDAPSPPSETTPPPPSSNKNPTPSLNTPSPPPPLLTPPKSSSPNPPAKSGALPPPAPKQGSNSSPSGNDNGSRKSLSKNDDQSSGIQPLIIGVAAGIALFGVLILISALLCCCKKKKKNKKPGYYNNNNATAPPKWQPQGGDHNIKIPPPPGMAVPPGGGWQPHGPPALLSGEMNSEIYSGPHGSPLPPPSPNLALGFNKSTFTYEELAAATGGFSQSNIIGQGGFGYVFKGILPNGKEVAVKQLKAGSGQGDREFQAEVDIISRVHHRHLVSLVGYCITGVQRILIYEFVPNKTLEYHLHGKGLQTMDWPTRLKIAIGSAKGLAYLHEDCHPRIIHRDIKAANILLDYKFEAMVADFGLAKLSSDTNTHVSTRVMGTFGYLAPEYASSGKLTDKSDVFSYGVMLLELITGRRPVDHTNRMEDSLVDWARPILGQILAEENYGEIVDPKLEGNYNPTEIARMIACGAACVRHSGRRRPKMSQIVRALEGDMISFDDLNEGVRPGQSSTFSSAGSDYESGTYSSKMRQFQKVALASGEYTGEYSGVTSEYGLNPSDSSSSSEEMQIAAGQKPRQEI